MKLLLSAKTVLRFVLMEAWLNALNASLESNWSRYHVPEISTIMILSFFLNMI